MNTKTIEVEMFDYTGRYIVKQEVDIPADIPTEIVSKEEYEKYSKEYVYNEKLIPNKAIYTQNFTNNCNGCAKYYSLSYNRLLINTDAKEYRTPTIGEAWSLGDIIR